MLPKFGYVRAESVEDAVRKLSRPGARLHAGGTDLLGCLHDGVFGAETVVSLSRIDALRGIAETSDGALRIGALATIAEIAAHPLVAARYPVLREAAISVASPQLREQGTLGGNLNQRPRCWYFRGGFRCAKKGGDTCYAYEGENRYHAILGGGPCFIVHPSDTAPALIALDAVARLAGPGGDRAVPLERYFVLPEQDLASETVLRPGEILTEVVIPAPRRGTLSGYRKVRERAAFDFALASVALAARFEGDVVRDPRVVLGGVAPAPWRSTEAESAIDGRTLDEDVARAAAEAATRDAAPLAHNGFKVPLLRGALRASLLRLAAAGRAGGR